MERGRAASQWISHSRPGLSAGGCARGEITGLLPCRSLHRHTVKDRELLAPGRLTDSPRHFLNTAIFSFTHVPLTKLDLHVTTSSLSLCRFQTNNGDLCAPFSFMHLKLGKKILHYKFEACNHDLSPLRQ